MIAYGSAPAADEIELTLFGPGYGEAIAVHLGEGAWLLVDSCIEPVSRSPASAHYLQQLGVDTRQVRAIVASHWHDDHVRGLSQLASACPEADFFLSAVLNHKEAEWFLAGYSGASAPGQAKGTTEVYEVIKARDTVSTTAHRTLLLDPVINGRQVMVTALSPTAAAVDQFLAHMAQYLPRVRKPVNHAPELRPNLAAVALHIDLGDGAILLGADLEEHQTLGWSAVVADRWSSNRRPATAYKVAHHGSRSGDCLEVWTTLLTPAPVACLAPFMRGAVRLPSEEDKLRVKSRSERAYISSGASRRPRMESRQLKRLSDVCKNLAVVDAGFGAVRLRRKLAAPSWEAELFGAAQIL